MRALIYTVPLVALAGLAGLAAVQLFDPDRSGFERIERMAPDRAFPKLDGDGEISFAPPPGGEAVVVNLFASWCAPCEAEHPLLTEMSEDAPGRVHGILYKDTPENGEDFLVRLGNPFAEIGTDPDGQGGLDFGLTGVPETFVVGPDGSIRLHVRGQLTPDSARDVLAALDAGEPR